MTYQEDNDIIDLKDFNPNTSFNFNFQLSSQVKYDLTIAA